MEFFKKLFGGGGDNGGDKVGVYFYVKPQGCTEVVRVRIDKNNDPSLDDDNNLFVRKTVRGTSYKCTRSAELYVLFTADRKVQDTEVTGGTLVTQADYEAWAAEQGGG